MTLCLTYVRLIVSEDFDPPLPRIKRSNVTEIRFRGAVYDGHMRYRWVINF